MLRNLALFKNPISQLNFKSWFRVAKADSTPAVLSRRHIYILPTRFGLIFGFLLFGMLLGSMNYSLSLGFALTFLLAGVGHAAMLHTWRNIAHLQLKLQCFQPTFAHEPLHAELIVSDNKGRQRTGVLLHFECTPEIGFSQLIDIPAFGEARVKLAHSTHQRGTLKPERIKVYSEFPLTLCHAWAYVQLESTAIIYPALSQLDNTPTSTQDTNVDSNNSNVASHQSGNEDFSGHKAYQVGDNLKKINWKASSKLDDSEFGTPNLLLKQFEGLSANCLIFEWAQTAGLTHEARISLLTRWVVEASEANRAFALNIPQLNIAKNSGNAHLHACLNALALMP